MASTEAKACNCRGKQWAAVEIRGRRLATAAAGLQLARPYGVRWAVMGGRKPWMENGLRDNRTSLNGPSETSTHAMAAVSADEARQKGNEQLLQEPTGH